MKGALFFLAGVLASTLLPGESPTWRTAALLAIAIWSFCRFYYFARPSPIFFTVSQVRRSRKNAWSMAAHSSWRTPDVISQE